MRFRTGWLGALCAAMVVMVGAGGATAEPPIIFPPERDDAVEEVPAEFSCGDFGVVVSVVRGKVHDIYFSDGRAFLHSPGAKYSVANADDSDRSVVIQGSGAFHDDPLRVLDPPLTYDEVTYELAIPTKMTGHNLLFGPIVAANGDVAPGVFAVRGRATLTILIDTDTGILAFADLRGGTMTDLCAVLR